VVSKKRRRTQLARATARRRQARRTERLLRRRRRRRVLIAVSLGVVVLALVAWIALHGRNNRTAARAVVDYSSAIDTSQQQARTTEGAR
jgi:uncharacterized membrane protein YvbJ